MASSTQFAPSRRMGIYDPVNQMSMWEDAFRSHMSPNAGACIVSKADARLNDKVKFCHFSLQMIKDQIIII